MRLANRSLSTALSRRNLLAAASAVSVVGWRSNPAQAETFPAQALRVIVPFPPGGSSDILSRTAATAIGEQLGQAVIVENRPGAGGNIAADYVYRSKKDGYTLLLAGQAIMAINEVLYHSVAYKPAEFDYVGMLGANANVFVVNEKIAAATTIGELIAAAKRDPGKLSFGSNGVGSLSHLTAELLAQEADVKFLHVPYRGAAPMSTDLIAGRIAFCVTGSTLAAQLVRQPNLRAVAVTTAAPIPQLPDVPALVALGFPSMNVPSWWSLVAAPGTPADRLAILQKACAAATASAPYQKALVAQSTSAFDLPPSRDAQFLADERSRWASAVKQSGATVN